MTSNPPLSAETRLFAVFGHPVAHSLSPIFQNAGLQAMGIPGVYLACDVPPEQLGTSLASLATWKAGGVNLTIPLKEKAFEMLDTLAESAELTGSVNTVVFGENGEMTGHSTDGAGLTRALEEAFGQGFEGRRVVILGCGGAGRAAALQAAREGATEVILANRTRARADKVEAELREHLPDTSVRTLSAWPPSPAEMHQADVIIQSTSLGMKREDPLDFGPSHFREGQDLLDMTYVHAVTPIMSVAQTAGARTANGIGMLLHQGVESLRLWTGQEPPVEIMREALQRAVDERESGRV